MILYDKNLVDRKIYVATEITFKLILSIYIHYVIFFVVNKTVGIEDQIFISFGAGLLMYDAVFNDIPELLEMYGVGNTSLLK